jgi:purine-cytosine permease-like protein
MLDKIMSSADAAINVGIKLISLAIVLQVVFSEVPFLGGGNVIGTIISLIGQLGDAGLVGILAAMLIYRLLDSDIRKELAD